MPIIYGYGLLKLINNMEMLIFFLCSFGALTLIGLSVALPTIKSQIKLNNKLQSQFESKFN